MIRRRALVISLLSLLLTVDSSYAAHQAVLGSKLAVKDPQPAGDASRRQWSVQAKETASAATVAGDPTTDGATVTIFTEGTVSASQSYALPQGVSSNGKPLWKATRVGFVYSDPKGVNGPVKSLTISRSPNGTFQMKAKAGAKLGAINVVPPNAGTRGCVRVDLGGGDSYHVLFGADATIDKNDAKQFLSSAPASSGLCCGLDSSVPCCPASCPATDACHLEGSCDPLAGVCENPARPDGSTCDAGLSNAQPVTCSSGACGTCTPTGVCTCTLDSHCPSGETCTAGLCSSTQRACAFDRQCPSQNCSIPSPLSPRYADNGDGTITDRQTCLVWEKKDAFDGTPAACPGADSCANPHDADNLYTWGDTAAYRNGSAFALFLAGLNAGSFAGHSDWRVPGAELQGLVDLTARGCGVGQPCIAAAFHANCVPTCSGSDPTCSCTASLGTWLSSSASVVDFSDGSTATPASSSGQAVRAVRGCTATASGLTLPSVKAVCINECTLQCGDDGVCIFGCLVGQDYSVDRCQSDCNGFSSRCVDSCLQTIDCISRTSGVEGACTPP